MLFWSAIFLSEEAERRSEAVHHLLSKMKNVRSVKVNFGVGIVYVSMEEKSLGVSDKRIIGFNQKNKFLLRRTEKTFFVKEDDAQSLCSGRVYSHLYKQRTHLFVHDFHLKNSVVGYVTWSAFGSQKDRRDYVLYNVHHAHI